MRVKKDFLKLDSILDRRVDIKNPHCIQIGKGVAIRPYTWLCAMVNDLPRIGVFNPHIEIGDGTTIGRFCHITISNELIIGDNVLITEGVLITDSSHGYLDVQMPIIHQPMISRGPIVIGEGSWICNRASIVGKVTIGKHSVIGVNTYIDQDVPDYCVVVGNPPRIIKRYDHLSGQWIRVNQPLEKNFSPPN